MKAQRIDEFHKYGCHFYGKLVVVDYQEDLQKDRRFGTFNAEMTFDYIKKAKDLIKERQYNIVRELLTFPVYIVEVA